MKLKDEAHYIIYRRLDSEGYSHGDAFALATKLIEEIGDHLTFRRALHDEGTPDG